MIVNDEISLQRLTMKIIQSLILAASLSAALISTTSCEPNVQKDEVESVIADVLHLASQHDIKAINAKYINKEFGIFDIYRIGAQDEFEVLDALPLNGEDWPHIPYGDIFNVENNRKKMREEYVEFDCGDFVFLKSGTFYSKELRYPLISPIVTFHTKYDAQTYDDALLKKIEFLESNSIRVVDTSSDFIFYITKIEGKWYITLIDRVTTDCSA
jgi:hypothetical protein